jgi:hypothetical protein
MNNKRAVFDLFLVSVLTLFVELVFIRWAASEVRMLAFYKNFALIAAFLGIGLGFAYRQRSPDKRLFERYFFPLLAISVILLLFFGRTALSEIILLNRSGAEEYIWAGTIEIQNPFVNTLLDALFYAILMLLFLVITVLFIPLGELTARKFSNFEPLPGYTINILGSLTGILLYTIVSFLEWPPPAWYLFVCACGLYYIWKIRPSLLAFQSAFAVLPILLTLFWPTGAERTLWSPYYRIDINAQYAPNDNDVLLGYELAVNKSWHQRMWNLDPSFFAQNYATAPEHFDNYRVEYDAPFRVSKNLNKVLIVGAGGGNDVAAALRAGTHQATAVEIDPTILRIGKEMHFESPYSDPDRVEQVVQDARSFFRRDNNKYDLIVFGRLDSHTLLSTASSVRLDNFVYTQESLNDVRNLLNENGLLALSFGVPPGNEWVGERIYRTLYDVFSHSPQVYEFPNHNILFLISLKPLSTPLLNDPLVTYHSDYPYRSDLNPVTDDWPYLYLQTRTIPSTYLIGLVGVILISLLLTRRVIPDFRKLNAHFFFLGAAFFLLETKSITQMALLFGSTWIVNAVVIAAILMMIVIANLVVIRFKITNPDPFYLLLIISLMLNFFLPVSSFLELPLALRISLSTISQVIPIFFAGMVFAISFSQTASIEIALGSNLIGAVVGGIFEYASLALGLRSLYILAIIFYLLSAYAFYRRRVGALQPAQN